jgi:hypothetical protein
MESVALRLELNWFRHCDFCESSRVILFPELLYGLELGFGIT